MSATLTTAPIPVDVRTQPAAAIYAGTVRHRRTDAVAREFAPRLFLAYLDLDALPASLDAIPLWSARRVAPVRFRRRDFFDGSELPLADAVRDFVATRIGRRPTGPVHLLGHLRTFGWLHNPLAVYYCWTSAADASDRATVLDAVVLDAVVLEVTNTPWGEREWYVFDAVANAGKAETPKAMHVSPFLPMDVAYRVSWTPPGADLGLRIEVERSGQPIFEADLELRREPLDRYRGPVVLLRYPMMTMRVSLGIYREAARLFRARVRFLRHPGPAGRRPES